MQAVLFSTGRMSDFMLDVVKNKFLLMLVVNCCDRRNIIWLCFYLVTPKKLIHFTVLKANKYIIFVPSLVVPKQTLLVAFVQILDPFSL